VTPWEMVQAIDDANDNKAARSIYRRMYSGDPARDVRPADRACGHNAGAVIGCAGLQPANLVKCWRQLPAPTRNCDS
jgi:hypothetical protein